MDSPDGRLRLKGFHVKASCTQAHTSCSDVTHWTQRSVVVDPDGAHAAAAS